MARGPGLHRGDHRGLIWDLGAAQVPTPWPDGEVVPRSRVDSQSGRWAAVKILSPEVCEHPAAIKRFRREAQATSAIGHERLPRSGSLGGPQPLAL